MENCILERDMLKLLEDQLRCRICSAFYNNCVMAICSHNFCSVCIKKRLITDKDCPNCFEVIQESDLRSNRILDKLVRFYKKIQSGRNNSNLETQNQRISPSQAQNNPRVQIDPDIQMVSVQSTVQRAVNLPESVTSQNSPLIHSIQSGLSDSTYPIKLEIVESSESDMNDVVMSTNSAGDSCDINRDLRQLILNQHKTVMESLKRMETKIDSLLPGFEGHLEICPPNQPTHDEVYDLISLLPISMKNFTQLNNMIAENSAFRDQLRKVLMTSGGNDSKSFIINVLKRLISNEVADRYSLTGRTKSSPKLVFEKTEVYKLILDVCFRSFPDSKENQLREAVCHWLVQSKTRIMRSQQKVKSRIESERAKSIEWSSPCSSIGED